MQWSGQSRPPTLCELLYSPELEGDRVCGGGVGGADMRRPALGSEARQLRVLPLRLVARVATGDGRMTGEDDNGYWNR